jgi:AAA+ superfamily predicted ATPase
MTDEISDLIEAAAAAPRSGAILRSLVRAAEAAIDQQPAIAYLSRIDPGGFDAATRRTAAEWLTRTGQPGAALAWCPDETAADLILHARCLIAVDRRQEAAPLYRAALARDPGLRSAELDEALRLRAADAEAGPVVVDLHGRRLAQSEAQQHAPIPARERVTFADVGGLEDVKVQIRRKIILPFQKKGLFDRFRKKAGGGVLLYGPPGCGKTLIARATAGECEAHFIAVQIPDILDMYIGESEKRLAAVFNDARARRPTVLFFDEIEALGGRRRFSDGDVKASMVSTFLSEFDGFNADNEGVLVLAATNVPWAVDAAFRRHGRFDRVLFVTPPDRPARHAILELQLKDRPQASDIDLDALAQRTSGYSGADLANIVETAADLAIEDSLTDGRIRDISQRHLVAALREVKPTTLEWLTTARNYAKFSNEGGLYDEVLGFLNQQGR